MNLSGLTPEELNRRLKKFYSHYKESHSRIKRRGGEYFKKIVFVKVMDDLGKLVDFDESLNVNSSQLDVADMKLVLFQNIDVRDLDLYDVKELYKNSEHDCQIELQFMRSSGPYYYKFIEVQVRF